MLGRCNVSQPANAADRDCSDFPNQAAAQEFFVSQGGPQSDSHRLDGTPRPDSMTPGVAA